MAKKENGEWQKPIRLDSKVNDSKSTNTQPSIGKAGGATYLYFTSNRDGGVGGLDIWRVKISSDGEVGGEPENLGKQINTKQDECTPFYDNVENVLYFSSNGKVGMGGFDIYKAAADGKSFLEPRNVGFPLNSCVDDRYFTLLPNHRGGFFVSNRPEDFYFKSSDGASIKSPTCCDDIFEYTIDIIPHFALKGYVFNVEDKEKAQPLTDVLVYLENNNEKLLKMDTTSFKQRKYFFDTEKDHQYKLKASANVFYDGYAAASFEGLTESDTLRVDIFLRPIKTETVRLEGIFYDFDKATLRPESDSTLQALTKFMSDQPNIRVEIASHTDNKGSDDYNERLSQARAQSVVDYLIAHGIESSRLEAKGYGERNPEVPNANPDGSDCPVCRQRNRRTEFKILGQVKGINIIYNQGMPSVIDSTASTHEKVQKEAMGEGREELNSTGQVTGATEQSFKDGIKMGGSSKGSGSIFNNKNYEQVQEKPKDVEDEQPEVIIKEVAPKKNNPPQPNFNAPPPSNNNRNNSTPNNDNNREIKNSGNGGNSTSTKNDEDEDKQPTPPKLNAKEKKEAEKAAKDEKVRIQKAEKEAKKKADEQAKKEKAKADAEAKKAAKQTSSKPVNDSKKSSEKEAKKKAESKAKKSSDENKADDE
jgi:outer membrane protein OmpA-like peptidoglycan-associated protein